MNILLTGFFGEGNLGDETILQAIFANLGQNDRLVFTSGNKPSISGPIPVMRKGMLSWPDFLYATRNCSKAIFSGGILQDWSLDGTVFFALRIIAAAISGKKPSLWGAGIGPIKSRAARRIAAKAINRLSTAWLRDDISIESFNKIKSSRAPVKPYRGTDFSWHFKVEFQKDIRSNGPFGLNLRSWPFSTEWKKNILRQLKFIDRHVIGISARKSDLTIIKNYAPEATVFIPESFQTAAQICSQLGCGIAMRYHVALAMLRSGIPVKLVGYDQKVINLANQSGIELLQNNSVSGFKCADKNFIQKEQQHFKNMQQAFKNYLAKK
jgi:polysaccharide pyruvyl transferase WcaK-like protein